MVLMIFVCGKFSKTLYDWYYSYSFCGWTISVEEDMYLSNTLYLFLIVRIDETFHDTFYSNCSFFGLLTFIVNSNHHCFKFQRIHVMNIRGCKTNNNQKYLYFNGSIKLIDAYLYLIWRNELLQDPFCNGVGTERNRWWKGT